MRSGEPPWFPALRMGMRAMLKAVALRRRRQRKTLTAAGTRQHYVRTGHQAASEN